MLKPAKRSADKSATAADEPRKKVVVRNKINKSVKHGDGDQKSYTKTDATKTGKPFRKPMGALKQQHGKEKFVGKGSAAGGKFQNDKNKFDGNKFNTNAEEKKDWVKFKEEKKALQLKRKKAKDTYEITLEAKQIYEKLKCRKTEQKSHLVQKLYDLLSSGDTIQKVVMAHDTARILQCMLKFASPVLRDQLSEKLLPCVVHMCQSKYSHFCVLRMLKYGSPSIKTKLVNSLFGHIVKLACHNISSKILDHIYLSIANAQQKNHMRQEFYGELYRKAKDENVKSLSDTYKESSNMKSSIMGAVKSNLEHVANKQLVDSALVHAVMLEYLQACDDDKIEETVSAYASHVPLMLTTKEGSQAAIICFYKSTTKNRRAIIKNIKEHLVKIATHEHGHVFLVAVLNTLDDTKATKKAIYDNLHGELKTLVSNQYGRHVVQWLVTPADTNCFHPAFISAIEEGLQYGKKDKDLRRKEIFEQIEEPISLTIAEDPNFWVSDSHIGLVTADVLKKLTTSHFVKATEALCSVIAQPNWSVSVEDEASAADKKTKKKTPDVETIIAAATKQRKKLQKPTPLPNTESKNGKDDNGDENDDNDDDDDDLDGVEKAETVSKKSVSGIEEAGMHIVLKKIIKSDKDRAKNGPTFGSILVEQLTKDSLKYWLTVNRACFVLLNIVEQNEENVTKKLKELLKDSELRNSLKQQKSKGAQLLAKKLE